MPATDRAVLRRMRVARRKNRGAARDWIDTSYELWLRAFFAVVVIVVVPIVLTGDELDAHGIAQLRLHAAGVASIVLALALWVALRAGASGAPLAPESPDVVYLLLAPVARERVLRPLAGQQLRTTVSAGVVVGAATGLAAAARLPSGPGAWALGGLLAGPCIAAAAWGAVALASARRLGRGAANGIGALLLATAVLDAVLRTWIGPTTWLGSLALLPLHGLVPPVAAIAGVALAIVLPVAALASIGGTSLEPLLRRSALTSQMRFAASFQDMRTVVLLHRQLSMEQSRRRPWIRIPVPRRVRRPVWRRGWHGYARWPLDRLARVATLLAGGAALAYAARSTPLLIVLAGVALFVAALDILEPFAAELDHPTSLLTYGVSIRMLLLRNLAAPVVAFVGIAVLGAALSAIAVGNQAFFVGACTIAAALAALGGAALNVTLGPPPASQLEMMLMLPDIYGMVLLVRQGLPPALAIAGLAPVVVAATAGIAAAVATAAAISAVAIGALLYSALRGV